MPYEVDDARVVRVALDKTALRFDGRVAGHCLRDLEASIGRDRAHDEMLCIITTTIDAAPQGHHLRSRVLARRGIRRRAQNVVG